MTEIIQTIIKKLYNASEEELDRLKQNLIALVDEYGKANVVSYLETAKRSELLSVQWEIDEVLEILNPPKEEIEEEDEDDPSNRDLRMSELELCYADPRGLRLYQSKVDARWVVMQMDPRTGGMVKQEIQGDQAERIKQQLAGSPYWVKNP